MDFSNPIENVQVQQAPPAPQPTSSTAGDVVQLAQFGMQWLANKQHMDAQKAAKQAEVQQRQSEFSAESLAVSRLDEITRIREERGAVHAQRYADQAYRADLGRLRSRESRKAYTDAYKVMFGGSPTDEVQDAALEAERARMETVEAGRDLLLGQGFTPEQVQNWSPGSLALVKRTHDGRAAYLSQRQAEVNLEAGQMNNQSQRNKLAARQAMETFNAGFSETIQDIRIGLIEAGSDEEYQQFRTEALNSIRNMRGNLRSLVTESVAGAQLTDAEGNVIGTAAPSDVPDSDIEMYEARIEELEKWITGDFAREQNAQQTALFDSQLELAMREGASRHTLAMIAAGLHGQSVDMNLGMEMFRDLAEQGMDYRHGIRVRVESESMPVSQAAERLPNAPLVVRDFFNELDSLRKVEMTPEERRSTGRVIGNAIAGTFEGSSASRRLANSSNGVLIAHNTLARNPEYAAEVASGIEDVARDRGMSVDQMYEAELESFTNRTLIPSLRAASTSGTDRNLLEDVQVVVRSGKIVFESGNSADRTDPNTGRTRGNPAPRTAGGMPTGVGRNSMQFQANLNKAARDLNTIMQSYANVTGGSSEQILQREAQAIQGWLDSTFGRDTAPQEEAPQERSTPQRVGMERTEDGGLSASF